MRPPRLEHPGLRAWLYPSIVVTAAILLMLTQAIPRIEDGSTELRRVQQAMHDEAYILSRVWAMVDRHDLFHEIGVYPGLYPYTVAAIRRLLGKGVTTMVAVEATRWVSLGTMVLALLLPFFVLSTVAKSPWIGAAFTAPLAVHPETVTWASRVHPDAFLILFDHLSLAFLALAVDRRAKETPARESSADQGPTVSGSWCLVLATGFAALSASTKLVGVFIFPCIAAWIVWSERSRPRALFLMLAAHALLFALVFAALNPLLFIHFRGVVDGFLVQQERGARMGEGTFGWWKVFIGPRGLGASGMIIALFGVARIFRRPFDGVAMIATFAIVYLVFILATVRLALPRYGFPATCPLFFAGLATLAPSRWKRPDVARAVAASIFVLFLLIDLPRGRKEIADYATFYARALSYPKEAIGRYLAGLARSGRRRVVSSHNSYLPPELEWDPVWTLDEVEAVKPDTFAIIVDPTLRRAGGSRYDQLVRGELGFTATSTIGEFVIYERGNDPAGSSLEEPRSRSPTTPSTP